MENMVSVSEYKSMNTRWMVLVAFLIFMVSVTVMFTISLYFTSDYEYVTDSIINTNTNTIGGVA